MHFLYVCGGVGAWGLVFTGLGFGFEVYPARVTWVDDGV